MDLNKPKSLKKGDTIAISVAEIDSYSNTFSILDQGVV
jgi:hypothetical protein